MYQDLKARMLRGEPQLLDGAIGTQLQRMGIPMDNTAWCATALESHPDKVLAMHKFYLGYGADIITTNTFSSARHNYEPIGMADMTLALNRRAVELAIQARTESASSRPVAVAGAISHFGILVDGEPGLALHDHAEPDSQILFSEEIARHNIREQAECLVEAGVDLLLLESTGNMTQRLWLLEETDHLDIPRWLGYRCRLDAGDEVPRVGYGSEVSFADGLEPLKQHDVDGVAIFHSLVSDSNAALDVLKHHWNGLIAIYPESGRHDYTATYRDDSDSDNLTPEDLPGIMNQWIDAGVNLVGGCCGIDAIYYENLKTSLRL